MWRLSGELAVNCSTLLDLPRQTHGLRWMRDELMAPPDRRLMLNVADDVQHWRQTLSGRTSILALLHSSSRAPAHTTYTGCVVVPAASVGPSEAVSRGRICGHLLWGEQPHWRQTAPGVDPVKNFNSCTWVILSNSVAVSQSISAFVGITLGFVLWLGRNWALKDVTPTWVTMPNVVQQYEKTYGYSTKKGSLGPSRLSRSFKVMDVGKVSQQ